MDHKCGKGSKKEKELYEKQKMKDLTETEEYNKASPIKQSEFRVAAQIRRALKLDN